MGPRAAPLMILRLRFWPLRWVGRRGLGPIRVSPAPTSDALQLAFSTGSMEAVHLALYDALGRAVYTEALEGRVGVVTHTLSLAGLPAGLYVLTLRQGAAFEQVRVVKE